MTDADILYYVARAELLTNPELRKVLVDAITADRVATALAGEMNPFEKRDAAHQAEVAQRSAQVMSQMEYAKALEFYRREFDEFEKQKLSGLSKFIESQTLNKISPFKKL